MAISINSTGKTRRGRLKLNSEINVTPFVDVMLVLLIIFIVTSPMLISGVEVDLPKTKSAPLAGSDEPLAITIDKNGSIYLNETRVELSQLEIKLQAILQEKTDTRIFVRGDKAVDYGKVMIVFSKIKIAGYDNVALVTENLDNITK